MKSKEILARYFSNKLEMPEEHWLYALIRLKKNEQLNIEVLKPLIHQTDAYGNTPLDIAVVARNVEAIPLLLSCGADPLRGLYNKVLLVSRIPEWKTNTDGQPSPYEQILAVPLNRCLTGALALQQKLPREVAMVIIRLTI